MDIQNTELVSQHRVVHGSRMHYVEQGIGDPIVFLHGMPTSSYLWRNIMPCLFTHARCIAIDLIGMGDSDKPDIEYSINDHILYVEQLLDDLDLNHITLVMHGWGSLIGFHYASKYPDKIKGLAFFESHITPPEHWDDISLPLKQFSYLLNDKDDIYDKIVIENYLVERFLVDASLEVLSEHEMTNYRKPFLTPEARRVLMQYVKEWPLGDGSTPTERIMVEYSEYLKTTMTPKLMLFAMPGFITTMQTVGWCRKNLHNLTLVDLGDAMHFAQESQPEIFAQALKDWYLSI